MGHTQVVENQGGIEPALRRCSVPTQIVWGLADTIFKPENARAIHLRTLRS